MTSEYDDSIWKLVEPGGREPDPRLAARARVFTEGAEAVLDLGCGDGLYLAVLGARGARVYGADRSCVALARAAAAAPEASLHEVGANERLPLEDNVVDRVWCCDTLEHVLDTQTLLSEARRVLRPGGALLVVTPDHSRRLRLGLALAGWEKHFDPFSPHLRFYTARSLTSALEDCGFSVERAEREAGALVMLARRA